MTSPQPVQPEEEAEVEQTPPAPEPEEETDEDEAAPDGGADELYQHDNGLFEVRVRQPIRNEE